MSYYEIKEAVYFALVFLNKEKLDDLKDRYSEWFDEIIKELQQDMDVDLLARFNA